MPDLLSAFQTQDLGYLRIVASFWGVELTGQETGSAGAELARAILNSRELADEVISSLAGEARDALGALVSSGGQLPWASFTRTFGEIREMGAGRRDRERPFLAPRSSAEMLFYRGLLARAFLETGHGPTEFAYIPKDLLNLLTQGDKLRPTKGGVGDEASLVPGAVAPTSPPGRRALPAEHAAVVPATDHILDDAATYLGALRAGDATSKDARLQSLLRAAGLISGMQPVPARIRAFIEADRRAALATLVEAWRHSETFDELRLVPGLEFEGTWKNPASEARSALLAMIELVPSGVWWSLPAFIQGIKKQLPDFQRPSGNYDSWFIRRRADGAYLRGFDSWDEVEGALVRYFVTGILHWLGLLDLATTTVGKEIVSFRRITPEALPVTREAEKLKVRSDGTISATGDVPRAVRYQLGRFCESEERGPRLYRYRITPATLRTAKSHGLSVQQLVSLLERNGEAGIPPTLRQALRRWEAKGTEARAETAVVLRVKSQDVLARLRRSKAARFLGEALGPTAVVVKPRAISRVIGALTELGILVEDAVEALERQSTNAATARLPEQLGNSDEPAGENLRSKARTDGVDREPGSKR